MPAVRGDFSPCHVHKMGLGPYHESLAQVGPLVLSEVIWITDPTSGVYGKTGNLIGKSYLGIYYQSIDVFLILIAFHPTLVFADL